MRQRERERARTHVLYVDPLVLDLIGDDQTVGLRWLVPLKRDHGETVVLAGYAHLEGIRGNVVGALQRQRAIRPHALGRAFLVSVVHLLGPARLHLDVVRGEVAEIFHHEGTIRAGHVLLEYYVRPVHLLVHHGLPVHATDNYATRARGEKRRRERDGYYLIQRLGLPEQYIRDVPFPPRLALHVHLVVQRVLEVDRARRLLLPQRLIGLPIGALAGPRFGHHLLLLLLHPFPLLLGERDRLLVGQHHGWKKAEKKGVVKGEDRFKARGGKIYSRSSQ